MRVAVIKERGSGAPHCFGPFPDEGVRTPDPIDKFLLDWQSVHRGEIWEFSYVLTVESAALSRMMNPSNH